MLSESCRSSSTINSFIPGDCTSFPNRQSSRLAMSWSILGMKYDIPSLNLSVLASVSDLFDTYRQSYTLDTPELKQQAEKRKNPRIIYFGLFWQFGSGKGKKQAEKVEYDEGM